MSGWIGLNLAAQGLPHVLRVNPVVGVYFARFTEIATALQNDIPRGPLPVIGEPLGYLMPGKTFRQWEFLQGGDAEGTATSLADAVREYGMPFIEKYSDWENLSRDIEPSGFLMEHEKMKSLPIILAINGDLERARGMVAAESARVSGHDDMYARSYRSFADRFLDRFGAAV